MLSLKTKLRLTRNVESRHFLESGSVPKKGRIREIIEKLIGRVPEKGAISVRTEKMVEFGRVPRKARIRPSIEKLFGRVPEKGSNQCV